MWWVGTNGYLVLWMGKVCFPLRLWIRSAPAQWWIRSVACRRLGAAGAGRWEVQPGRRLSTTEPGQEAASSAGVRGPEALAYQDACASLHASPSKTETIIKDGKALTASCCAEKQKQPGNITWNAKLAFPSPQMWPPSLQGLSLLCKDLTWSCKGLHSKDRLAASMCGPNGQAFMPLAGSGAACAGVPPGARQMWRCSQLTPQLDKLYPNKAPDSSAHRGGGVGVGLKLSAGLWLPKLTRVWIFPSPLPAVWPEHNDTAANTLSVLCWANLSVRSIKKIPSFFLTSTYSLILFLYVDLSLWSVLFSSLEKKHLLAFSCEADLTTNTLHFHLSEKVLISLSLLKNKFHKAQNPRLVGSFS